MTDNAKSTGLCPFCREPVKVGAKKCPHCHQWQGRWAFAYHPPVMLALLMIPLWALFAITGQQVDTRESFANYRDQIAVVESAMHYQPTDENCGPTISVIGKVKNDSDVGWQDIYLERYSQSVAQRASVPSRCRANPPSTGNPRSFQPRQPPSIEKTFV